MDPSVRQQIEQALALRVLAALTAVDGEGKPKAVTAGLIAAATRLLDSDFLERAEKTAAQARMDAIREKAAAIREKVAEATRELRTQTPEAHTNGNVKPPAPMTPSSKP